MAFEKVNLLQTVSTTTQLIENRTEFDPPIYNAFVDCLWHGKQEHIMEDT
jgi:hypothetical protein